MKKKVLFACHGIGNGGAERVLLTLANNFAVRGYNVTILTTNEAHNDYEINSAINRIIITPKHTFAIARILNRLWQIRKTVKLIKPDTIISFSANINVQMLVANIGLDIRTIISERTDPTRYPESAIGRKVRNLAYLLANHIVFQTEDARSYFSGKIKKNSSIIHNPICINIPVGISSQKENLIIGVGSLGGQKNWKLALSAFSLFVKEHPRYIFEIYGEGPLRSELEYQINSDQNLRNKVFLKGFCQNIVERFKCSNIYVSSSIFEGISNSMLEALALGVPVICTDCPVGGARMFIKNNNNGILVPMNDVTAMYKAMSKYVDDPLFADFVSTNSVKIRKELAVNKIVDKWVSLLNR